MGAPTKIEPLGIFGKKNPPYIVLHAVSKSSPIASMYIHLHEWLIFMVNVGKNTIHGSYGPMGHEVLSGLVVSDGIGI